MQVRFPGQEDPLEEGMASSVQLLSCVRLFATHSSILAWRIPKDRGAWGLRSIGSHRVRHDCSDLAAGPHAACLSLHIPVL